MRNLEGNDMKGSTQNNKQKLNQSLQRPLTCHTVFVGVGPDSNPEKSIALSFRRASNDAM
jgi:hypothetical protein